MDTSNYISQQISRIDDVIRMADQAKEICNELRKLSAEGSDGRSIRPRNYAEDTLKVFDTSYSQGQIERLTMRLQKLKKKLIEIKIENDQLLLDGGFLPVIDETISDIFLPNTLCRLLAKDPNVREVMDDIKEKLGRLRETLSA